MSSTKVAGQVVYRISNPFTGNPADNLPVKCEYDIRFGAGNKTSGKVANRLGASKNREMSVKKGVFCYEY